MAKYTILVLLFGTAAILLSQQTVEAKPFFLLPANFFTLTTRAPSGGVRSETSVSATTTTTGAQFPGFFSQKLSLITSLLQGVTSASAGASGGFNFGFKKLGFSAQASTTTTRKPESTTKVQTVYVPDTTESIGKTTTTTTTEKTEVDSSTAETKTDFSTEESADTTTTTEKAEIVSSTAETKIDSSSEESADTTTTTEKAEVVSSTAETKTDSSAEDSADTTTTAGGDVEQPEPTVRPVSPATTSTAKTGYEYTTSTTESGYEYSSAKTDLEQLEPLVRPASPATTTTKVGYEPTAEKSGYEYTTKETLNVEPVTTWNPFTSGYAYRIPEMENEISNEITPSASYLPAALGVFRAPLLRQ